MIVNIENDFLYATLIIVVGVLIYFVSKNLFYQSNVRIFKYYHSIVFALFFLTVIAGPPKLSNLIGRFDGQSGMAKIYVYSVLYLTVVLCYILFPIIMTRVNKMVNAKMSWQEVLVLLLLHLLLYFIFRILFLRG